MTLARQEFRPWSSKCELDAIQFWAKDSVLSSTYYPTLSSAEYGSAQSVFRPQSKLIRKCEQLRVLNLCRNFLNFACNLIKKENRILDTNTATFWILPTGQWINGDLADTLRGSQLTTIDSESWHIILRLSTKRISDLVEGARTCRFRSLRVLSGLDSKLWKP